MGIGPGQIGAYLAWESQNLLARGAAILDIGAQELFCASDPQSINNFVSRFQGEPFPDDEVERLANKGLAGEMFVRAGFPYRSIDYKPYPFGITLDLNRDRLPWRHRGRYSLVTNHGTSEHILNQWNVFSVIHQATRARGLMFHAVPMCGELEHGIVSYMPKFFWALATANAYDIIAMWAGCSPTASPVPESFLSQITFDHPLKLQSAWLAVLMRKTKPGAFKGLMDPAFA